MSCTCGHSIEEHQDERGECSGTVRLPRELGKDRLTLVESEEPCRCVAYEEDEEELCQE